MSGWGARRLAAHINSLPPDSALVRKMSLGWDDSKELQASTIEVLHALYRATLAAAGAKEHQLPPQISIPRPVDPTAPATTRAATEDETLSFFAALAPAKG